jgi:hypothetical protein
LTLPIQTSCATFRIVLGMHITSPFLMLIGQVWNTAH